MDVCVLIEECEPILPIAWGLLEDSQAESQ